jgi:ABC-type nickel/cobalt efflux system permease component RcnA
MSDSGSDLDNSRPYTIGFSIAVILILLIAIFHIWRILFKKIKKYMNHDELGTIVEVSSDFNGARRISKKCVHKLEVKLVCDDIEGGLNHVERRTIINKSEDGQVVNFLAGYSHKHIDSSEKL